MRPNGTANSGCTRRAAARRRRAALWYGSPARGKVLLQCSFNEIAFFAIFAGENPEEARFTIIWETPLFFRGRVQGRRTMIAVSRQARKGKLGGGVT